MFKCTNYFSTIRQRPDRKRIKDEWIEWVMDRSEFTLQQADGRVRKWAKIVEADNRYLRVVLLEDGQTVHNAFFDRRFKGALR